MRPETGERVEKAGGESFSLQREVRACKRHSPDAAMIAKREDRNAERTKRVAESPVPYVAGPPGIARATVRMIVDTIAGRCHPDKIVVFGSCARGESGPASDLDLLAVMPSDLPRHKRAAPIRLLFDPAPCPMDILVFTPGEVARWNGTVNHIVTEALQQGVVAYERPRSRTGKTVA
jgi:hypothetical protein